MATTLTTINADVSKDRDYIALLAKQYDHLSRKYRINITDNGMPVTLTGNENVLMRMQAEGESTPYVEKWLGWENGNIVVEMTSYMLSKIGMVYFDFVVYEAPTGVAVLSTRLSRLKIQKSLIDYDGIVSSEDFDILSDIISQGLTLAQLIIDSNASINEMNTLITSVNTQMATYQTEFTTQSQELQDLMTSVTTYMSNVENAAAASATLSKSFAIGTTGTRTGEDTDCAKYYYQQAKIEADKASVYADIVIPDFSTDLSTGHLTYTDNSNLVFITNYTTGHLNYTVQ